MQYEIGQKKKFSRRKKNWKRERSIKTEWSDVSLFSCLQTRTRKFYGKNQKTSSCSLSNYHTTQQQQHRHGTAHRIISVQTIIFIESSFSSLHCLVFVFIQYRPMPSPYASCHAWIACSTRKKITYHSQTAMTLFAGLNKLFVEKFPLIFTLPVDREKAAVERLASLN